MTKCDVFTWTKEGKPKTPITIERIGYHNCVGTDGPIKVPLFDESAFEWLHQTMREHILDGYDCPYIVTGDRRRGKSVFVLKLSRHHCPSFRIDNVHFNIEPFIKDLQNSPMADPRIGYYPTVDYDESITGLNNQEWQSQVPYVKVLNIIGKKQITMPVILPHISDMNPKVTRMMSFWVYIFERGLAEIRIARSNQFSKDIFWVPYGAIKYDAYADDDPFWRAYNVRKDKFIEDYTASMADHDGPGGLAATYRQQRNKLVEHVTSNGMMQTKEIAELLGVKQNTVSMWKARDKSPQIV